VYISRSKKVLFILLLIIIFIPLNLYAGGKKEDRIPEALSLVEQRQYNDAILILTEIMKTSPDQFTEAQKLIQKISIARDNYNKLYEKLIILLDPPRGESIDEESAYTIIREMEALDSNPNKAAVAAFSQAKKSIVFAVDDRTYANIMKIAADHINNKEYPEAIDTYFGGFELHKDLFVEKNYGNIASDQVLDYQNTILTTAKDFLDLYSTVLDASKIYSDIIQSGLISEIERGYSDYSLIMLETGSKWRILKSNAAKLDVLKNLNQKEDESDIPYISIKKVLTVGRSGSAFQEGIAGVISTVWDENQENISSLIMSRLEELYKEAIFNFEDSSFAASRNILLDAVRTAVIVVDVIKLRGDKIYLGNDLVVHDNGLDSIFTELPDLLFAQAVVQFAALYTDMSLQSENINSLVKTIDAAGVINDLKVARSGLDDIRVILSGFDTAILDFQNKKIVSTNPEMDLTLINETLTELKDNKSLLEEKLFIAEVRAEERILTLRIRPERIIVENSGESIITAEAFIDGIEETINGLVLKVMRPDQAVLLLNDTKTDLEKAEIGLEDIINSLDTNNPLEKSDVSISTLLEAASELVVLITKKYGKIEQLLNSAKILNDEADDVLSLGNLRLDEAYSKFYREDFDGARKKYYEAESLFLKSLEFREDEKVRNLLTQELTKLDSDITVSLNRQIVREVRSFITRGKDFYNLQEFIKAEQIFQQAQERFKVTNVESNPEIENWLIKIKRALEATSGREIALTDPLYHDIISILNLVQEEFDKGKTVLKSGNKEQANIHFNEAIKNIELIKTPFPRNFKASVMYLQILEYTQQDAFRIFFKSMYDSAVKNIDDDPKTADDDLLALYEINSDYPGIKTAVYRSGVSTGRIIPPPAQVDLKRATQLYNQASTIVNTDNRAEFPIALAYLEEAIQINSDFDAAALLMDKIRTSTGVVSQVVMSSSDTQQLRYAESLYIEGRYLEANIIINQLWAISDNRKSSKLNDLKTKVEARL
jgi:tetratricopeptide (TPR) repeat protein